MGILQKWSSLETLLLQDTARFLRAMTRQQSEPQLQLELEELPLETVLRAMNVILKTIFHNALILLATPMWLENIRDVQERC